MSPARVARSSFFMDAIQITVQLDDARLQPVPDVAIPILLVTIAPRFFKRSPRFVSGP